MIINTPTIHKFILGWVVVGILILTAFGYIPLAVILVILQILLGN